jgi:hypothetical protein
MANIRGWRPLWGIWVQPRGGTGQWLVTTEGSPIAYEEHEARTAAERLRRDPAVVDYRAREIRGSPGR